MNAYPSGPVWVDEDDGTISGVLTDDDYFAPVPRGDVAMHR
jgi:hypothetical protein